jgi:hypothetical protein
MAATALFSCERRTEWIFMLLGFCLGLKLSAAPPILYILLLYFFDFRKGDLLTRAAISDVMRAAGFFALGFVVCSPNILYDFTGWRANLLGNGLHGFVIPDIDKLAYRESYLWDYIRDDGVFLSLCAPLSMLAFAIVAIIRRAYRSVLFALISCSFAILLMTVNGRFLFWYMFSCAVILMILVSYPGQLTTKGMQSNRHERVLAMWVVPGFLALGIVTNAVLLVPKIAVDQRINHLFSEYFTGRTIYDDCIVRFMIETDRASPDRQPVYACYPTYRYDFTRAGFCEPARFSDAYRRVSKGLTLTEKRVFNTFEVVKPELLSAVLTKHVFVSMVNEKIEDILGEEYTEKREIDKAVTEFAVKHNVTVLKARVGQCGMYGFYRYEVQNKQ